MKKTFNLAVIFMVILGLLLAGGCGGKEPEKAKEATATKETAAVKDASETITFTIGSTATPTHSYYRACEGFLKEIEQKSGGKIKAKMAFSGVLGGEREMVEAVRMGTLEMAWSSDIGYGTVVKEIGFAYLPYLFTSYEDVDKYYRGGWVGDEVKKILQGKGLQALGWLENDFRGMSSSVRPIRTIDDLKGQKIRVPEIPELLSFFKEAGAVTVAMPVTELLTALQQRTVDAQDNGVILTYSFGFYGAQKYLTLTNHCYSAGLITVSDKWWKTVPPEYQKIIADAADAAGKEQVRINREDVSGFLQKMKDSGIQVVEKVEPETDKKFKKIATSVWEKSAERYDPEIIKRIVNEFSIKK